jgi:type IV secretion system protein VirD4
MRPLDLYRLPTSTRERRRSLLLFSLAGSAAAAVACLALAASRIAYLSGYPVELGPPLLAPLSRPWRLTAVAGGAIALALLGLHRQWRALPAATALFVALALVTAYPVYPPAAFFLARRALATSPYAGLLRDASVWAAAGLVATVLSVAPLLAVWATSLVHTGDLHGSARLARAEDIVKADFLLEEGPAALLTQSAALPLGNVPYRRGNRLVRAKGDVHVLLFAPPGSGKTTSFVIPTAQDWNGSAVILDVKGEIAAATAGHRQRHGSRILLLDPSRNAPTLARYNPLMSIRPHRFDVQDASELAQLLVPDRPGGDPFWSQSARTLLEGVFLHVLYAEAEKSLSACYRFLCSPTQPIEKQFERMLHTDHDPQAAHGWKRHPRVEMAARTLLDMPEQTRGGVVANALASLSPYADPILAEATSVSDFALDDLYRCKDRPVTLYLVIDPNSLQRLREHIRIIVSQIAAALTRELPTDVARHPVLLLLDEFPVFGRMAVIETAVAYFRGYGVQCYFVVQHLGQLLAAYGRNESISPNCSVHIAYAPADLETAQALSKRAGSQTVRYERGSVSSQGLRNNVSVQEADSGRPLFMPEEIMRLPKNQALILRTRTYPFLVSPRPFFQDSLRVAAARLPIPASEPTGPDLSHWLGRAPAPPPPPSPAAGKREKRTGAVAALLHPEIDR